MAARTYNGRKLFTVHPIVIILVSTTLVSQHKDICLFTWGHCRSALSTIFFSGITFPPRTASSAVITVSAWAEIDKIDVCET